MNNSKRYCVDCDRVIDCPEGYCPYCRDACLADAQNAVSRRRAYFELVLSLGYSIKKARAFWKIHRYRNHWVRDDLESIIWLLEEFQNFKMNE
jgi:hypothetical protein